MSHLTDKGKAKLKLAVPDLSQFEFNTRSDYQKTAQSGGMERTSCLEGNPEGAQ